MAIQVLLQTNMSEKKRVDKNIVSVGNAHNCTLKDGCNITNPTLILTAQSIDLKNTNYMTVSAWRRSYFITDIKSLRNNIVEVTGKCDVISSFKSEIRTNTAIVGKNENTYNLYLDDGTFRVYNNPIILTRKFPAGFSSPEFVLAVAGR